MKLEGCGVRRLMRQSSCLRQSKRRWHGGHGRAGQRRDDANGAEIVWMVTGIRGGRRRLLRKRLNRRRRWRCDGMEVAKGKGKLDRERKQRDPCPKPGISPNPLHRDD